jgi:hypothetical protein
LIFKELAVAGTTANHSGQSVAKKRDYQLFSNPCQYQGFDRAYQATLETGAALHIT